MKFISFSHNGQNKFGIINNNKITDLTGKVSNSNTLKDLISNKGIEEAKNYAKILGYNYNSSEWFEQSYKILNKDYEIKKIEKKKEDKNIFKKIIQIIK